MKKTNKKVVTFWGCRGSVAHGTEKNKKYGINTSCVSVEYKDHIFVFDAGTGIIKFSNYIGACPRKHKKDMHLFLSHYHYDHIEGIPYISLFNKEKFNIYGPESNNKTCKEAIENAFAPPYYPEGAFSLGNQKVETLPWVGEIIHNDIFISYLKVPHPGGCLSYRIDIDTWSFCYLTDYEWQEYRYEEILNFIDSVDLLIIDAHFSKEDYKKGWGHNYWEKAVEIASEGNVKQAALFHHHPFHFDKKMEKFEIELIRKKETPCFFVKEDEQIIFD